MVIESVPTNQNSEEQRAAESLQFGERPAGLFQDSSENEPWKVVDLDELLESLQAPKSPEKEVDVRKGGEQLRAQHQQITKLLEKEREREHSLQGTRAELGVPHENGETLKKLEEAKEQIEENQHEIELAGEFNDVLDSFGDMSSEEREHIARTGKKKNGESIYDKNGKAIGGDLAKELAHLYGKGGRRVTWRELQQLGKVAERLLKDAVSIIKGIFTGSDEEQSFSA